MKQIILYAIGSLFLYNFWAWVIRHILTHHKGRWIWMHILIIGSISTTIIWAFPKLAAILGINQSLINTINLPTLLSYLLYMALCGGVLYIGYIHRLWTQPFLIKIGLFLMFFCFLTIGGLYLGMPKHIIYFSLVAFGEEYIKYVFGFSLFEKLQIHYTDLLLFCLISGFAFAFIENIFYVWYSIQPVINKTTIMQKCVLALQSITQRGLINVGIHGLFTAIIGWMTLVPVQQKKSWGKILLGISLGVGLHIIYNTLVAQKITFVIPVFVLFSYAFVSYILFKADTFYNQPSENGISNTAGYNT